MARLLVENNNNEQQAELKQIPPAWLDGDGASLETLLEKLMSRCKRVPDLIRDCQRGRINPFPEWR